MFIFWMEFMKRFSEAKSNVRMQESKVFDASLQEWKSVLTCAYLSYVSYPFSSMWVGQRGGPLYIIFT